jgi:hypothetical protein
MSDRSRITPRATALKVAGLAFVGILAFGTNAAAGDEPPATEPTPDTTLAPAPVVASSSSVSLMLLGAPLTIDISIDPGGNLVDVALNPLNPTDTFTATTVKPNNVVFVNEAEGVSVKVKAKHGGERIEARAADLTAVSGAGQWKGDVFENGQPAATVDFTVGARADGSPDITGVAVTSSVEFTIGDTEYNADDERASASVAIQFADSGQKRTLRFKVSVRTGEDHTSAKLTIGLSRIKGAEIPDGLAVGQHTWGGMLCDGTDASVTYTVGDDGSITDVTASPEGADIKSGHHGTMVRFATGEWVQIKVRDKDGVLQVGVKDRIRCDAPDPTVNTPIDPDADTGDGDSHDGNGHGWGHGDGGGDQGGDDGGRGHHRHDRGAD